jgi:hypothetical protein
MKFEDTKSSGLADIGQRLLAHSRQAEFTARRGLVVELFPYLVAAHERMSARAIARFLEKEQGIKLSAVTINKALKDPAKNWNLFFDLIEPAARTFAKDETVPMKNFLFREKYFWKQAKNPIIKAAAKVMISDDVSQAIGILRGKWYVIDWEVRLKARPYLEHRLT